MKISPIGGPDKVKVLADMKRANDHVLNYHTKNGIILARDSRDKRYARIQPLFTREEIIQAMADAPALSHRGDTTPHRFLQSHTLQRIPAGHVLNRAVNLDSLVVDTGRRAGRNTRQAASK